MLAVLTGHTSSSSSKLKSVSGPKTRRAPLGLRAAKDRAEPLSS